MTATIILWAAIIGLPLIGSALPKEWAPIWIIGLLAILLSACGAL